MLVWKRLFQLAALLLVLSLLLAACERPIPGSNEDTTDTVTEATPDANVGGGESAGAGTGEQAAPEPTAAVESDTPRVEAAATPEPAADSGTTDSAPDEADAEAATTDGATSESESAADTTTSESTGDVAAPETPQTHTVAAGENLYRIGLKYNVSWVTLAEYNNLPNANQIKVGQVLKIPGSDTSLANPTSTPSPLTESTYVVKAGDNLFRIGLKYNINWTQIAEANGIVNPNQLKVGQELKIPVDTPGPTPQFTHQVASGETLFLISLHYGVAWQSIAGENNIDSPYVIYVGQTLVIPGE